MWPPYQRRLCRRRKANQLIVIWKYPGVILGWLSLMRTSKTAERKRRYSLQPSISLFTLGISRLKTRLRLLIITPTCSQCPRHQQTQTIEVPAAAVAVARAEAAVGARAGAAALPGKRSTIVWWIHRPRATKSAKGCPPYSTRRRMREAILQLIRCVHASAATVAWETVWAAVSRTWARICQWRAVQLRTLSSRIHKINSWRRMRG